MSLNPLHRSALIAAAAMVAGCMRFDEGLLQATPMGTTSVPMSGASDEEATAAVVFSPTLSHQCFGTRWGYEDDTNRLILNLCDFDCCTQSSEPPDTPDVEGGHVLSMTLRAQADNDASSPLPILPGSYQAFVTSFTDNYQYTYTGNGATVYYGTYNVWKSDSLLPVPVPEGSVEIERIKLEGAGSHITGGRLVGSLNLTFLDPSVLPGSQPIDAGWRQGVRCLSPARRAAP